MSTTKVLSFIIMFLIASSLSAQTWEGDVSSDWNDPLNWSGNTLPGNGDDVTIDPSNYTNAPVISANSLFDPRDIFIQNGGTLTQNGGTLSLDDLEADNGTFSINGGILDVDRISGSNNANINLSAGTVTTTGRLDANSGSTFTISTTVTQTGANDEDIDIGQNATFNIQTGANISGYDDVDFDQSGGSLIMTGGTLEIDDDFKFQDGDDNTVNITGGTLNVGDDFEIETDNNQITFGGTADVNVDGQFEFGAPNGSSPATNSNVNVEGNATLDVTGDINFYNGGSPSNTFLNVSGDGAVTTNNVDDTDSVNTSEGGTVNNGGTILPVELLFFSGSFERDAVVLKWSTASELNNDYFEVLHSKNGIDFLPMARISGAGTTTSQSDYELVDPIASGVNYYQLRQVDFDGESEAFNIVRVESSQAAQVAVYPNPVPANTSFSIQSSESFQSGTWIKVYSMDGREVLSKYIENSSVRVSLESTQLDRGNYVATVISNNKKVTRQFVIK